MLYTQWHACWQSRSTFAPLQKMSKQSSQPQPTELARLKKKCLKIVNLAAHLYSALSKNGLIWLHSHHLDVSCVSAKVYPSPHFTITLFFITLVVNSELSHLFPFPISELCSVTAAQRASSFPHEWCLLSVYHLHVYYSVVSFHPPQVRAVCRTTP